MVPVDMEPLENLTAVEWVTRGIDLREAGEHQAAETVLLALTRTHPEKVFGWQELGVLYARRGRADEACRMFETAIAAEPDDILPRAHYACVLLDLGRAEEADRIVAACHAGTEERAARLASLREYLRYVSARPEHQSTALAHQLEGGGRFCDAARVEAAILDAIARQEPFSLVRIGDGEGAWITTAAEDAAAYPVLYAWNRQDFLRIWFGDDRLYWDAAFAEAAGTLPAVLGRTDMIGIPTSLRVAHEYRIKSLRGVPSIVNALLLLVSDPAARDRRYCSQDIHIELQYSGFYARLFGLDVDFCVITCHAGLALLIQRRTGARIREAHLVPEEKAFTGVIGANGLAGPHFPDRFAAIMADIARTPQRGRVWLVAAGILGKLYCDAVRRNGGVAIDIGSIADGWCGKLTRPTFDDLSRFALPMLAPAADTGAFLRMLGGVGPIRNRTILLVAHPDDEMIAAAGTLTRFADLHLIHVADATPHQPELASLRRAEIAAALQAAEATPVSQQFYGLTDGAVIDALESLIERLIVDLAPAAFVITHAYEGGHIDHDACAFAVHRACAEIARRGKPAPAIIEFAGYHSRRGTVRAAEFRPHPDRPPIHVALRPDAVQRRVSAFACHRSQAGNLGYFPVTQESFREAPVYDFLAGPPGGESLYGEAAERKFQDRIRK